MRLLRRSFIGLAVASLFGIASAVAAEPVKVVATTGMIADTARTIGGEAVVVQSLMGPGVDPHAYRQTRSDVAALVKADLVLWHGLYLEAQMEAFLLDLAERQPVVAVGEAVPAELLRVNEDYADKADPHVWMAPALWAHVTLAIRDALIEVAPEHEAAISARAQAYLADLEALEVYANKALATVPQEARALITAHDAFGYFGQAHGFEVLGIQGISTESEAGLNRIRELVRLIVDRKISAVFVESSVSDRNIRAVIEGAADLGHEVRIGGELFSDAMGQEGTYEGTYPGMIDHNVTLIARALGGTAPDRGRLGKLAAGS